MKALKMLVVLNLIVFLVVSQSDKAIAFDKELFGCPTTKTLEKGEWKTGVGLWCGIVPLAGCIKLGITSKVEALVFVEPFNCYYGLKINCLKEKKPLPAVTVAFCQGIAADAIAREGSAYNINCLYLIFSKDVGNLKLNTGIGKGKNPPLFTIGGGGFYNTNGYFTYGSIEKEFGKTKIFLETNRFKEGSAWAIGKESAWAIGISYKVKRFLFKLAGGFWSEKFFELPKNGDYYLMPVLTIEYNKKKGD